MIPAGRALSVICRDRRQMGCKTGSAFLEYGHLTGRSRGQMRWRREMSSAYIGPCDEVDEKMDRPSADVGEQARRFAQCLTDEERMLVVLKHELYEGDWDEMAADLRARLDGKPYIFKLANRIEDDLERIERLRAFERDRNVDLSDYVEALE